MTKLRSFFSTEKILIGVVPLLLYLNILKNDYSLDDSYVTKKSNVTAQGIKAIPEILTSFYIDQEKNHRFDYRPVVKISYALEHEFFGVSPLISHLFNISYYILSLFLVYRFLSLLVNDPLSKLPFYITLLFSVMPIHTEVVASLKNRDILLCFIFSILACISVLKAHRRQKSSWLHYAAAFFFLVLAFFCKLDVLPFFAILPVMVFFVFRIKLKGLLFYVVGFAMVLLVVRLTTRLALHGMETQRVYYYFENPLYFDKDLLTRLIALFNTLGFYLVQCLLPFKQSCYYGTDTLGLHSLNAYGLLGIGSAALLLYGMFYAYRRQKTGFFMGLFMFSASVSIYLNFFIPSIGIAADRFAFFCSLGFSMGLVFFLKERFMRGQKISPGLKIAGMTLLVLYGFMTFSRNADWKNVKVLIASDLKKYPNSSYLNYLQGVQLVDSLEKNRNRASDIEKKSLVKQARKNLERSLEISGDYPNALNLLSYLLVFWEYDYRAALPVINRSLSIEKSTEQVFSKGVCLRNLKMDSSEYYFKETIRMDSTSYNAYQLLMEDYNAAGKYQQSIAMYNEVRKKGLQTEPIFMGLAITYWQMKDTLSAEFYCEKTLALNPRNPETQKIIEAIHR